jgi:hypothetical protein
MDNYATHKTPKIRAWLARRPHYHVHFTPTSASWINQVERWFAELTRKRLRRGIHTSVKQLEADIRSFIDRNNQNPRPFKWTKSADQILASVQSVLFDHQNRKPEGRALARLYGLARSLERLDREAVTPNRFWHFADLPRCRFGSPCRCLSGHGLGRANLPEPEANIYSRTSTKGAGGKPNKPKTSKS